MHNPMEKRAGRSHRAISPRKRRSHGPHGAPKHPQGCVIWRTRSAVRSAVAHVDGARPAWLNAGLISTRRAGMWLRSWRRIERGCPGWRPSRWTRGDHKTPEARSSLSSARGILRPPVYRGPIQYARCLRLRTVLGNGDSFGWAGVMMVSCGVDIGRRKRLHSTRTGKRRPGETWGGRTKQHPRHRSGSVRCPKERGRGRRFPRERAGGVSCVPS